MNRDTLFIFLVAALSIFFILLRSPAAATPCPSCNCPVHAPLSCACNCRCVTDSQEVAGAAGSLKAAARCDVNRPHNFSEPADLLPWFEDLKTHAQSVARAVAELVGVTTDRACLVLDVGANVGAFSYNFLREKPHCTVIAFEAIPWYAKFASAIVSNATWGGKFEIYSTALSSEDGAAEILVGLDGNRGWNSLLHEKRWGNMQPLCVPTVKFTTWLRNSHRVLPYPAAIKIDTEGAEGLVLNGMRDWLAAAPVKPPILVEIAWGKSHPLWEGVKAEFEFLFSIGYERFDYDSVVGTSDWIISPKGSRMAHA